MSHQVEDCSEQESKPVVSCRVIWCCRCVHDVNIQGRHGESTEIWAQPLKVGHNRDFSGHNGKNLATCASWNICIFAISSP